MKSSLKDKELYHKALSFPKKTGLGKKRLWINVGISKLKKDWVEGVTPFIFGQEGPAPIIVR